MLPTVQTLSVYSLAAETMSWAPLFMPARQQHENVTRQVPPPPQQTPQPLGAVHDITSDGAVTPSQRKRQIEYPALRCPLSGPVSVQAFRTDHFGLDSPPTARLIRSAQVETAKPAPTVSLSFGRVMGRGSSPTTVSLSLSLDGNLDNMWPMIDCGVDLHVLEVLAGLPSLDGITRQCWRRHRTQCMLEFTQSRCQSPERWPAVC